MLNNPPVVPQEPHSPPCRPARRRVTLVAIAVGKTGSAAAVLALTVLAAGCLTVFTAYCCSRAPTGWHLCP